MIEYPRAAGSTSALKPVMTPSETSRSNRAVSGRSGNAGSTGKLVHGQSAVAEELCEDPLVCFVEHPARSGSRHCPALPRLALFRFLRLSWTIS